MDVEFWLNFFAQLATLVNADRHDEDPRMGRPPRNRGSAHSTDRSSPGSGGSMKRFFHPSVAAFLNACLLSFVLMFLLVGSNVLVSRWLA
jgi:hypothetical protein